MRKGKRSQRRTNRTSQQSVIVLLLFAFTLGRYGIPEPFQIHRYKNFDSIEIYVLLYRRPQNSLLLLEDLNQSNYNGSTVSLHIIVDHDETESPGYLEVLELVAKFEWHHGPLQIQKGRIKRGLVGIWLSIGHDCKDGTFLAIFEDDLRVSPYWFLWTHNITQKYLKDETQPNSSIIGVSLTPVRVKELSYPYVAWDSTRRIHTNTSVYLHNLPSSWGPVFTCDHWKRFLHFVTMREGKVFKPEKSAKRAEDVLKGSPVRDPNFNLPNAFSNTWTHSWKRLLIEYCFLLGKAMLYPNIIGQAGLASNLHLHGSHVSSRAQNDHRTNPLIVDDGLGISGFVENNRLAVFDIYSEKSSREQLQEKGEDMLHALYAMGGPYENLVKDIFIPSPGMTKPLLLANEGPFMFACPVESLHEQMLHQIAMLRWAREEGYNLILPHLLIKSRIGYEFVPFGDVFEPPPKIGTSIVRFATFRNLMHFKPDSMVAMEPDQSTRYCLRYATLWNRPKMKMRYMTQSYHDHGIGNASNNNQWIGVSPMAVKEKHRMLHEEFYDDRWLQRNARLLFTPNERTKFYVKYIEDAIGRKKAICLNFGSSSDVHRKALVDRFLLNQRDKSPAYLTLIGKKMDVLEKGKHYQIFNKAFFEQYLAEKVPYMSFGTVRATALFMEIYFCSKSDTILTSRQGTISNLLQYLAVNDARIIYFDY